MTLRGILFAFLYASSLIVMILLPMPCKSSPVEIADARVRKSNLNNAWQEFLWDQQEHNRHKKQSENLTAANKPEKTINSTDVGASSANVSDNQQKPNKIDTHVVTNDDEIRMEYFCMPDPDLCPTLKHYHMYIIQPEDNFYPSWTYHGFNPPSEWHNVPIKYFDEPPLKIIDEMENMDIRKHGSAMHLCTEEVTDDIPKCKEKMKNECLNSMPSPINIIRKEAKQDPQLLEFDLMNYNVYFGFEMYFETDGSQLLFVKVLPHGKDEKKPGIRDGPLREGTELYLDRILFRTGLDYMQGSEHTLDGTHFGMEIQFFFTADELPYWQILSKYKTLPDDDPTIGDQLHVISLLVNVVDDGKEPPEGNLFSGHSMETLSLAAEMFWEDRNVNNSGTVRVEKKVINLDDIFGGYSRGVYYTYQGSLSHPPCLTHVGWTIFEKPIWIKRSQWRRFAYAHAEYSDYKILGGNIRHHSQIKVKVDIEKYIDMKAAEGYGNLLQTELDEAAEDIRWSGPVPSIHNDTNSSSSPLNDLYLIRKYVDYQKYFAMQVRKSVHLGEGGSLNEYDYYANEGQLAKSTAIGTHGYHPGCILGTISAVVAVWMVMILWKQ